MEKKISLLIYIPIAIILVSLAGFYKSYLSHFPRFYDFKGLIHIHFLAFSCWFALIVIQPVLIRRKQYILHKKLGRISYFLIPILAVSILMLRLGKMSEEVSASLQGASMNAFITVVDIISLCGFYLIAVVNSNNIRRHVAFMLAASLVAFNPGFARLLNLIQPGLGMSVILTLFIVPAAAFIYEKVKFERPILKSPYFAIFMIWLIEIILVFTVPATSFWQNIVLQISRNV